jgi:endonuclease-3 related protein
MSKTSQLLMEMYRAMHGRFGHQGWWPGQSPLEICVGAILTQNTNWTNVAKAIANLQTAGVLDLAKLHSMPPASLAELIRPAGYYNIKARRLKNFLARVVEFGGDLGAFLDRPVSSLREDLLAINGIGRETADSIILYAAGKATFVVDAYTYRILLRHRLIAREDDYEAIKEFMESSLPAEAELYNDYHAQLVAVGKNHCRPAARCEGCPLESFPHDPSAGLEE